MPSSVTLWSLAFVATWLLVGGAVHLSCRGVLSESTPRKEGNAMVAEAHGGYHVVVVATVVVAYLSPLGERLVAVLSTTDVSALPPVVVTVLTNAVVLAGYSLLALVGILVVYLGARPLYSRTTDKRPPLGRGLLALSQSSASHFGPAFVVVLVTTVSRWPVVSAVFVTVLLVVVVPLVGALHDRLLTDSRAPTAQERALVTGGGLPSDVYVRVGSDDYDNHQIAVTQLLPERPQVFLGGDVFSDLSEECIRTMLRIAHRQSGWAHCLKMRMPVGVWVGVTTGVLIWLDVGFLLSVGGLICSYLFFAFGLAPFLDGLLLTEPDGEAAAFEEFAETRRVPLEAYLDPDVVAPGTDIDAEDVDHGPSEPVQQ